MHSLELTSKGIVLFIIVDNPKSTFTQLLKKKVGPSRYKKGIRKRQRKGKRSNKKLKNRTSAMKKIEPGKPKKTKQLRRLIKKSLGHKKLTPPISVIRRVLNLRLTASTKKKELDDRSA
jgi:hypothetical protein